MVLNRLNEMITGFEKFQVGANGFVMDELNKHKNIVIKLNIDQIFNKGKDSEDKPIKHAYKGYSGYSPKYERRKKKLGLYQGYIDTHLSGKYLKSYVVTIEGDKMTIEAVRDEGGFDLAEYLRTIYPGIEGLTDDAIAKLIGDFIRDRMITEMKKI